MDWRKLTWICPSTNWKLWNRIQWNYDWFDENAITFEYRSIRTTKECFTSMIFIFVEPFPVTITIFINLSQPTRIEITQLVSIIKLGWIDNSNWTDSVCYHALKYSGMNWQCLTFDWNSLGYQYRSTNTKSWLVFWHEKRG